jgi:hypothetical protein
VIVPSALGSEENLTSPGSWLRIMAAVLFLIAFYAMPAKSQTVEVNCESAFVTLAGAELRVATSGEDDTENLQCALNEATRLGIQKVKLDAGTYVVSSTIAVGGFEGQLEGRTRDSTIISLSDDSFDCPLGDIGAGIAFGLGSPSVKFLTIEAGDACITDLGPGLTNFTTLAFTSDPENCERRTTFGLVDRVSFVRAEGSDSTALAVVTAKAPTCLEDLPLLGTFKLNRSRIDGFTLGLFSSMGGGAQVDVNFNEFTRTEGAIQIVDANQNTTITGNSFIYGNAENPILPITYGLFVTNELPNPRTVNRTVVHNNRFFDEDQLGRDSYGVLVAPVALRPNHSMVISSNRFEVANGTEATDVLALFDMDGGTIQNNVFVGAANAAASVSPFFHAEPVVDWAIFGNRLAGFEGIIADFFLGQGTSGTFIGPQGASIVAPEGNFIATQD